MRRLLRRSTVRASERAYVAEGIKIVEAALEAGAQVEGLFVAADRSDTDAVNALVERALSSGIRVFDLGPGVMERVSDTVTPQAVCAVVAMPNLELAPMLAAADRGDPLLVLVCVDVRDPGNLGAVIRSGAGAGASAVVCAGTTADLFNPKTVRATAGTIFRLPLAIADDVTAALSMLTSKGLRLVATTAHEGVDYALADLSGDIALVLGNEASGLDDELLSLFDERVTIPMAPFTESLNVAMTATVLSYEVARRRRLS